LNVNHEKRLSTAFNFDLRRYIKVIGVEPEGANCMLQSLYHGEICRLTKVGRCRCAPCVCQHGIRS
jgi:threonine dehydratase